MENFEREATHLRTSRRSELERQPTSSCDELAQVLACGHLQGQNDFSDPDKHGIAVHDTEGAEVIRRRMNTDGILGSK